jgi:hypothetical protein
VTADLDAWLEPLPPERRTAVVSWLTGERACSICGKPLERSDAHATTETGVAHLGCATPLISSR